VILKELSEAMGVSGDEGAVRVLVKGAIRDHVDELWVDNLGNLLAIKRGAGRNDLRVMLAAHMDEVAPALRKTEPCASRRSAAWTTG